MYFLIVLSFDPTVETSYTSPQNVGCELVFQFCVFFKHHQYTFTLQFPIKLETLVLGGILSNQCTWSGIVCLFSIFTPFVVAKLFPANLFVPHCILLFYDALEQALYGTCNNHFVYDNPLGLLSIKFSFWSFLKLEEPYCTTLEIFLYNFLRANRIAGGSLFRISLPQ